MATTTTTLLHCTIWLLSFLFFQWPIVASSSMIAGGDAFRYSLCDGSSKCTSSGSPEAIVNRTTAMISGDAGADGLLYHRLFDCYYRPPQDNNKEQPILCAQQQPETYKGFFPPPMDDSYFEPPRQQLASENFMLGIRPVTQHYLKKMLAAENYNAIIMGDRRYYDGDPKVILTLLPTKNTTNENDSDFGTGPLIQDDRAFNFLTVVWPQLVLSSLAVLSSLLLIVAISLSFFYDGGNTSGGSGGNGSTNSASDSKARNRSGGTRGGGDSRRSRKKGSCSNSNNNNSTYNIYLVYLAIPHVILNVFVIIGMYGSYVNQQQFNPAAFSSYNIIGSIISHEQKQAFDSMALILSCSSANLYLNAIISYELFTLLKNSHGRKRTAPPTFRRVTLQAAAVYVWAIFIFLLRYFIEKARNEKNKKNEADIIAGIPKWVEVTLYFMVSAGIPIIYLCYICIVIWRQKLLPSMRGPFRILAIYFFRIIPFFILLWLPGVLLLSFACGWERNNVGDAADCNDALLYPAIGLIFCSIQPIVSTGMALTKPDVRAAVMRMMGCLSYCIKEVGDDEIAEEKGKGQKARRSTTIKSKITTSSTTKSALPDSIDFAVVSSE